MRNHLLDTKTINYGEFISNGKTYKVPDYQRDYSWSEEHWSDLWQDILVLQDNTEVVHYLGSIVLQSGKDKQFTIIDGQQRIATLSIIIIALIRRLDDFIVDAKMEAVKVDNEERRQILVRRFLGDKEPISLKLQSKLFLNENNDGLYQTYLLQFRYPRTPSRLSDSDKLMCGAQNYYYKKICELQFINSGEAIANFAANILAERLFFIQITVQDELNAYTVFETLNARGMDLTATDLLKNYLFSLVAKPDLSHAKVQWQAIIDTIGMKKFPIFLRDFLNSQRSIVRKDRLFKEIKSMVCSAEKAFALLDDLEEAADIYAALTDPYDERWNSWTTVSERLQELQLFNVKQNLPMLLIAYKKMAREEFEKLLHVVVVISFRYNKIGGLNPNILEELHNKAAIKIFNGELDKTRDIFSVIKEAYVSDDEFQSAFANKKINARSNKKLVRYILCSIEKQQGNDISWQDTSATIEHILPENPDDGWQEYFTLEEQERDVDRLGNYCLLEGKLNSRGTQNGSFENKSQIYKESQYLTAKKVAENDEWTPEKIRNRQKYMAKLACAIWKVNY